VKAATFGIRTVMARRVDRRKPSMDLFQPLGSTALSAGDYHVDVLG
jgi:hypothetical protein